MERSPESQQSRRFTRDDALEAKDTLKGALRHGYRNLGISVGINETPKGFEVTIRVPKDELVAFAKNMAKLNIPGAPIDVRVVKNIRLGNLPL